MRLQKLLENKISFLYLQHPCAKKIDEHIMFMKKFNNYIYSESVHNRNVWYLGHTKNKLLMVSNYNECMRENFSHKYFAFHKSSQKERKYYDFLRKIMIA